MEDQWCCLCAFTWVRIRPSGIHRFGGRLDWSFGWSWLSMAQTGTRQLVHAMKYHGVPELGAALGQAMAEEWVAGQGSNPSLALPRWKVVPVPLHRRRQRRRGFNQSMQLALGWSEATGMEIAPALARTSAGTSSTRFNRKQRIGRPHVHYTWQGPLQVCEKETEGLIVMDDVVTTGSTLESMHCALRKNWAGPLAFVTLADAAK